MTAPKSGPESTPCRERERVHHHPLHHPFSLTNPGLAVKLQATFKKQKPTVNTTSDSIHTFINKLQKLDCFWLLFGVFEGVVKKKSGIGKLWDSLYYLIGGRGVVNNLKTGL